MPKLITDMSVDDLFYKMGNAEPGSVAHGEALAEMERRRFIKDEETSNAQIRAANAEERAADAAIASANHAEKNAKYMLWTAVAALLLQLFHL
jgi:multidrug resistance efflux pump